MINVKTALDLMSQTTRLSLDPLLPLPYAKIKTKLGLLYDVLLKDPPESLPARLSSASAPKWRAIHISIPRAVKTIFENTRVNEALQVFFSAPLALQIAFLPPHLFTPF